MIRIYIDWNVMSQMKSGAHKEFFDIISDSQKFLKAYSTSHLADIASSENGSGNSDNVDSDLKFISDITDFCLSHNGGQMQYSRELPSVLYKERIDLENLLAALDIDEINGNLNDKEQQAFAALVQPVTDFNNQPIDDIFRTLFEDPEQGKLMRRFLPDLENNYTNIGLLTAILKMFKRQTETGDYRDLRELVQMGAGIKRDRLFSNEDPYGMIEKAYVKKGIDLDEKVPSYGWAPDWFNKVAFEYIKLDTHGYQEDKVKVDKGRKQTFKNTMEDAFHTAFATTCDFYITCDQRNYNKAQTVYEKLELNTLVLNPQEFVTHYAQWLHHKEDKWIIMIPLIMKNMEPWINSKGTEKRYQAFFFLFDFFNRIHLIKEENKKDWSFILLTRQIPSNSIPLIGFEAKVLLDKLLSVLGKDIQLKGSLLDEEVKLIIQNIWPGRSWLFEGTLYKLQSIEGYLQLYIYPKSSK